MSSHTKRDKKKVTRTHYPTPDALSITDSLELEAVLETRDAVSIARRAHRNDEFVVR